MTEQQLKLLFDPGEYVTRLTIVLLSVHSGHFLNLYYILLVKTHAAVNVCVLWLSEGHILVFFH